jgi:molybdate-binding protein/DNA-binding XRE family transcriptional regulator
MPDDTETRSAPKEHKLADLRLERGLTQTALARQIGVSRQFFNQLEAGRVLPNVVIALRLAATLEHTVEELFGNAAQNADQTVAVTLAEQNLATGARLRIGRVGQTWIAHPADTSQTLSAGFHSADAVLESAERARLLSEPAAVAANVLIAGCDPALALLQPSPQQTVLGRYHWIDCGSGRALDLLLAGQTHVAGIHYAGPNGSGNTQELLKCDPQCRLSLVRFTRWEQGWIVRHQPGRPFAGVSSLVSGKWMLANRDRSAAAYRWLLREFSEARVEPAKIPGFTTSFSSATEGAQAVARGQADVTIGPQAVAMAHGLDFVPAEAVDFDLVAASTWWRSSAGCELLKRITELVSTPMLAGLPGYAPTQSGAIRPRDAARIKSPKSRRKA